MGHFGKGGEKELTVRRLERHGKEVPEVKAGDRASLNLVGLDKADFKKGKIISDKMLKETVMLDARIELLYNLHLKGEVYRIKDDYIHAGIVDSCREKLVKELSRRGSGITVAEFRDLVGGNRKICLLLLAQYDAEMVTRRDGDYRYLIKEK